MTEFDVAIVIRVATGTLGAAVKYAEVVMESLPLDPGPAHLRSSWIDEVLRVKDRAPARQEDPR